MIKTKSSHIDFELKNFMNGLASVLETIIFQVSLIWTVKFATVRRCTNKQCTVKKENRSEIKFNL